MKTWNSSQYPRTLWFFAMGFLSLLLMADSAFAQGRRNFGGGGQGGPGGGQGGNRFSFDANGDGIVTPDEVPERMRDRFETALKEAGKDPSAGVKADEVGNLLFSGRGGNRGRNGGQQDDTSGNNGNGQGRRNRGNRDGGDTSADETKKTETKNETSVQGFGTAAKTSESTVKGFGMEVKPATTVASTSAAPSSAAPAGDGGDQGGRRGRGGDPSEFALRGMLGQLDKDHNGQLEKSEWAERPELEAADTNKDGTITSDELKAYLASGGGGRGFGGRGFGGRGFGGPGGGGPGGGGPGGGGPNRGGPGDNGGGEEDGSRQSKAATVAKPKRTLMPAERLPKGLPDWFYRNDKDADGQISMSEFATSWNDSELARFNGFDTNGDGFLTPAEVLRSLEKKR